MGYTTTHSKISTMCYDINHHVQCPICRRYHGWRVAETVPCDGVPCEKDCCCWKPSYQRKTDLTEIISVVCQPCLDKLLEDQEKLRVLNQQLALQIQQMKTP